MQKKLLFILLAQVFDSKYGFLNNLSTLDLLFNLGPEAKTYYNNVLLIPIEFSRDRFVI